MVVCLTVPPNAGGSARAREQQRQQGQRSRPVATLINTFIIKADLINVNELILKQQQTTQ